MQSRNPPARCSCVRPAHEAGDAMDAVRPPRDCRIGRRGDGGRSGPALASAFGQRALAACDGGPSRRATGAFTRAQAEQLAHRIVDARSDVGRAPVELSQTAGPVEAIADALLVAVRDLEALPAPDDSGRRGDRLAGLADGLGAIERALARTE